MRHERRGAMPMATIRAAHTLAHQAGGYCEAQALAYEHQRVTHSKRGGCWEKPA